MTETTLLDERAVEEIEARPSVLGSTLVRLTVAERDALCATVKHLRSENERLRVIIDVGTSDDPGTAIQKVKQIEKSAVDDFRSRVIKLCKDKAAEWERDGALLRTETPKIKALAAKEIVSILRRL